ncbi:MAG TPA: R3H domain-containing nucleic acid-binding protein [Candidatus Saccharimonadales bacterium]|nr:R3H domain-containing nucleic acid-binding protein [Candidatus Saccharimonadales bacterium]
MAAKSKASNPTDKKPKLDEDFVANQTGQIIENLGVSASVEVEKIEDTYNVDIASEDSSLLIGKYGSNLESLQFILAVRLKTLTGDDNFEVYVDIDGFRKQKEEKLKKMAVSVAQDVAQSGKSEPLYNLKASERRVVHMALEGNPDVVSESEGEGEERHLVIKPRK